MKISNEWVPYGLIGCKYIIDWASNTKVSKKLVFIYLTVFKNIEFISPNLESNNIVNH